jgi:hypothetical protein
MAATVKGLIAALSVGTALAGVPAMAQTPREAALEARLAQLEAAVAQLRGDLAAARAVPAAASAPVTATALLPETEKRLAALETAKPADGFKVGGTTIKIGGYVRVNAAATRYNDGEVAVGGLGKEFYLPQQIPVGGGFSSQDFLVQARQTRFVLNTATPVGADTLKSHIEFDFALSTAPAGAQRATNAFNPTLRRAFFTYGKLLVGQEWSTFQNVSVLPETTDFVGPLEGTVFVRQGMAQYKLALSERVDLLVALENPETEVINQTSPALIDNDDDRLPDVVARVNARTGVGDFTLAGIVRELRVNNAGWGDTALGWGVSAAGRVPFGARHDLRFMATYGNGLGRYLGLGFAPDAVFAGVPGARLETVRNFAGFGAVKLGWTASLRSTFMAGYQSADYGDSLVSPLTNKAAWSVAGNLFWTPAKNFDVGIEYRHGERRLVNSDSGSLDRLEAAFKYTY